jgi:hypothetical protein
MEVEEEFLHNAASMARFAEEEIKQFVTWTGKRSPCNRTAEEIKAKLQTIIDDIKLLKKEYVSVSSDSTSMCQSRASA